jgi:hypothetical protein
VLLLDFVGSVGRLLDVNAVLLGGRVLKLKKLAQSVKILCRTEDYCLLGSLRCGSTRCTRCNVPKMHSSSSVQILGYKVNDWRIVVWFPSVAEIAYPAPNSDRLWNHTSIPNNWTLPGQAITLIFGFHWTRFRKHRAAPPLLHTTSLLGVRLTVTTLP